MVAAEKWKFNGWKKKIGTKIVRKKNQAILPNLFSESKKYKEFF